MARPFLINRLHERVKSSGTRDKGERSSPSCNDNFNYIGNRGATLRAEGNSNNGLKYGAFTVNLNNSAGNVNWNYGAADLIKIRS